jgi:HK97 family phage prohead protease
VTGIGPRLFGYGDAPLAEWDDDDAPEEPSYTVQGGVGVINIMGTLVQHASGLDPVSGLTSYESLTAQFSEALADSEVAAILFRCDSPGGEVPGMLETSDLIFRNRGVKPIIAVVNDTAASAAYCVASAANRLIVSRTSTAGSVGCFIAHCDQSAFDQQAGLKYSFVFSGSHKLDGNPHSALSEVARLQMQNECDRIRGLFAACVARNRGVSVQSILATEAAVRFGPENVPLFADAVGDFDDVLAGLIASSRASVALAAPGDREGPPDHDLPSARAPRLLGSGIASVPFEGPGGQLNWDAAVQRYGQVAAAMQGEAPQMLGRFPGAIAAVRQFRSARAATASGTSRKLNLLIVPYDASLANLGAFDETYRPGCFRDGLGGDLRAMFAHADSSQYVLGRKSAGTCQAWEDRDGVHMTVIAPETSWANDLLISMTRSDINQCSAGFWIVEQSWSIQPNGRRLRTIEKAILRDGSIEPYPAYVNTVAEIASSDSWEDSLAAASARLARLRADPTPAPHPSVAAAEARLARLRGAEPDPLAAAEARLRRLMGDAPPPSKDASLAALGSYWRPSRLL